MGLSSINVTVLSEAGEYFILQVHVSTFQQ